MEEDEKKAAGMDDVHSPMGGVSTRRPCGGDRRAKPGRDRSLPRFASRTSAPASSRVRTRPGPVMRCARRDDQPRRGASVTIRRPERRSGDHTIFSILVGGKG